MIITNQAKKCVVEIEHELTDVTGLGIEAANVRTIVTQRKENSGGTWQDIYSKSIVAGKVGYTVTDYTALSRRGYYYRSYIQYAVSGGYSYVYTEPSYIKTDFKGMLIAEADKGFVALFSPKAEAARHYNIAYIKPYYSYYPHSVVNGSMNHYTGTFSGIFNRFNDSCQVKEENGAYADKIADFLTDRNPKVIKTHNGSGWYGMIDEEISINIDECGLLTIEGQWTEIGTLTPQGSENYNQGSDITSLGYVVQGSGLSNIAMSGSISLVSGNTVTVTQEDPNVIVYGVTAAGDKLVAMEESIL